MQMPKLLVTYADIEPEPDTPFWDFATDMAALVSLVAFAVGVVLVLAAVLL
jgi:hypothetical protein